VVEDPGRAVVTVVWAGPDAVVGGWGAGPIWAAPAPVAPGSTAGAGPVAGTVETDTVVTGAMVAADLGKGRPEEQATVAVPSRASAASNGTRRRVTPPINDTIDASIDGS
jgi:hypothetical protein